MDRAKWVCFKGSISIASFSKDSEWRCSLGGGRPWLGGWGEQACGVWAVFPFPKRGSSSSHAERDRGGTSGVCDGLLSTKTCCFFTHRRTHPTTDTDTRTHTPDAQAPTLPQPQRHFGRMKCSPKLHTHICPHTHTHTCPGPEAPECQPPQHQKFCNPTTPLTHTPHPPPKTNTPQPRPTHLFPSHPTPPLHLRTWPKGIAPVSTTAT